MVKKVIVKDIKNIRFDNTVACIGYFDGVHKGHQKLINRTIKDAKRLNVKSSVICFEPDPINLITGKRNKHLTSYKTRLSLFEYFGIDIVYVIKFDAVLMKISAVSFINKYLNKMNIIELVCGFDFSFGYKARGNCELLLNKGKFSTIVIQEAKYSGKKISSTRIKEALIRGDFSLVNKLLGYSYSIDLKVINCLKQGKNWLIITKLSDSNGILPNTCKYQDIIEIKENEVTILGKTKLKLHSHLYLTFDE